MDETLHALGELLLKALPTFVIVVFLHYYLKFAFFKPLEKVLEARREATEGARQAAEASLRTAQEKASQHEAAIRAARADMYREQEQLRRQMQDAKAAAIREARARAESAVAEAKAALGGEAALLTRQLEADSEALSEQIAASILGRRAA
ncbi:MAG: hypothetical protein HYR60_06085 [Acidobacteria bacterium]|nr:hypothetical protein [Acidobacteriota bacterium]MBI3473659.1 hypothetical protein [Candidatus Solibacter usitatus]